MLHANFEQREGFWQTEGKKPVMFPMARLDEVEWLGKNKRLSLVKLVIVTR